ncbi:RNA ligase family protein [Mesorhizobium sp. AA22]|uniref:ATP-dependent DNA ligase n=1 Tax=Mesorhizobium sp. AA22 TaxID=1854057 RepID=UPI001FF02595|nr:RNA ligase family protein [Mesorhizobium sp. AA22]
MAKPPEGEDSIHEIKLDGYRAQVVIDEPSVRIFTRRGLDWTSKYRDLAEAAKTLDVESAIIDGEIIVLNDAGLSDFGALRKATTRRQHDLYFVAFDLLHINGTICATWHWKTAARSWLASFRPKSGSSSARRCRARPRESRHSP